MADTNEAVMAMVRSQLEKNPDMGSADLYERAKKMNRAMGRLTLPQFHARYPLQVKRLSALGKRSRRKAGTKSAAKRGKPGRGASKRTSASSAAVGPKRRGPDKRTRRKRAAGAASTATPARATVVAPAVPRADARANVQEVLLQFAGVVATADKADMVQLMLRMDSWIDRVLEAAR
jgi:hypothetical protein